MRRSPVRVRGTQAWRKLAKQAIAREPVCWLRLPGCTIYSSTGDHVIPVSQRPDLELNPSNIRAACRSCNAKRGNNPAVAASLPRALQFFA